MYLSIVRGRPYTHVHTCNICCFAKDDTHHDLLHCRVLKGYCNASFAVVLSSHWFSLQSWNPSLNLGRHREVLSVVVLVQPVIEVEVDCKVQNRILITPNPQVHCPWAVSTGLSMDTNLKMHCSLLPHGIPKIWKIRTLDYQIFGIVNASQSLVYDADLTLYLNFHMYVRKYILICSLFSDRHLKFQILKI